MRSTKNIILAVVAFAFVHGLFAQPAIKQIPVNLQTVLKLAGANNLTIKQYDLLYQRSQAEVAKANEWYLPTLYIGPEIHYLQGAAMRSNGEILPSVTQKELWLGGGFGAEWNFGDGIYNVMAKKQHSEAIKAENQAQRNNVILVAIADYYDLLTAQFQYNQFNNLLVQADTLTNQIKAQVDIGLRYQSEYLLAKSNYDHIRVEVANAQMQMLQKSNTLLSILNVDTNGMLVITDTSMAPLELIKNVTDTSAMAYNQYYASRPEYKSMQAEMNAIQDEKKTTTVGLLMPKLFLGSLPDGVLGGFGSPYNSTYRLDGGLLWTIPLGRLIYQGDVKIYNSDIMLEQNNMDQFKNQVHLEVDNARAQLILAMQQIKISSSALSESRSALTQSIERERLGTVRPFEVFQSEQFFVQAELDYLKSVGDYNKAQYQLYVAMANNL